jgi:hypothetical protein
MVSGSSLHFYFAPAGIEILDYDSSPRNTEPKTFLRFTRSFVGSAGGDETCLSEGASRSACV